MLVTRTSVITGVTRTRDLPITAAHWAAYYEGGSLLQDAFPHLSDEDREFVKTGITSDEWDSIWDDEEDYAEELA